MKPNLQTATTNLKTMKRPFKRFPFDHNPLDKVVSGVGNLIHLSPKKARNVIRRKRFPVSRPHCKVLGKDNGSNRDSDDAITVGLASEEHLLAADVAKMKQRSNTDKTNSSDRNTKNRDDCCNIVSSVDAIEARLCTDTYENDVSSLRHTDDIGREPQAEPKNRQHNDNIYDALFELDDLERHAILGQGEFGQVWLVSKTKEEEETTTKKTPYALKIQPKYNLVRFRHAEGAVREMEIMLELNHHPFLLPLERAFQDDNFIYMLSGYVPGGELDKRMHTKTTDGLPESDARFYAAGILEGLSFMHQRQIVYRDLKPENVVIDHQGYPVLIDFGFAKHVPDKTYTRCGSPCYMAPEVIKVGVGYDFSADNWALGCLIHEMITGDKPFDRHETELALYMAICSGYSDIHPFFEENDKGEALDLVQQLFVIDPSKRLGAAANIFDHPWFQGKIDFNLLREKEILAPWVPTITNAFDVSNFDDMNDLQDITKIEFPELSQQQQAMFS